MKSLLEFYKTCSQRTGLVKHQSLLGECMNASDSEGVQSISSKKSTYGLSENESVLSRDSY